MDTDNSVVIGGVCKRIMVMENTIKNELLWRKEYGERVERDTTKNTTSTQEASLPNISISAPLLHSVNIFTRRMIGNVHKPMNY